jgi:hypothetical protein
MVLVGDSADAADDWIAEHIVGMMMAITSIWVACTAMPPITRAE